MADARDRHNAEIRAVLAELRTLRKNTPHRRDLERHLHRLQKELRTYDFYMKQRG